MPIRPANSKANNGGNGWGPPVEVAQARFTLSASRQLSAPDAVQPAGDAAEIIIPEIADAAWLGLEIEFHARANDRDNVTWFRTEVLRGLVAAAAGATVDTIGATNRNALVFSQSSEYYRQTFIGRTENFRLLFGADNAAEDANPVRLWKIP